MSNDRISFYLRYLDEREVLPESGIYLFYSISADDVEHSLCYSDKNIMDISRRNVKYTYFDADDFERWCKSGSKIAGHTADHYIMLLEDEDINDSIIFIDVVAWEYDVR